jgi:inner membrane protein
MDNLTHSLIGVVMSRAGLDRYTPRAPWILLFAANAPDIDAVTMLMGVEPYFWHHRGITHSLVMIPVLAILPVVLVAALFRTRLPWLAAWSVAVLGVGSHVLIDYTNAYGIRLFLPFRNDWPGLDSTGVIDLWIWAALLIGLLAPALSRLVSSEIGAPRTRGRGMAWFSLLFIFFYDVGRWVLHERAVAVQNARVYQGAAPARVLAFPDFVNPLEWRGVVETERFWLVQPVNLAKEFSPAGQIAYKPDVSEAIEAARRTPTFQRFLRWSKATHWRTTPAESPEGATRVEAIDLRFGGEQELSFAVTAIVDRNNKVLSAWFSF